MPALDQLEVPVDGRAERHPGVRELCNDRDDNCDGKADNDIPGEDFDVDGTPFDPYTPDALASNGPLHPVLFLHERKTPAGTP